MAAVSWPHCSLVNLQKEITMISKKLLLGIVALTAVSGVAQAAGDAQAGKVRAAVCAACHGANGQAPNPIWPNLAGQNAPYLIKQLKAFKSGERKDPLMSPQASTLSDKDMEDVAAYFASLK
jgi:cytochrome c553